jgi:hypothetical protein
MTALAPGPDRMDRMDSIHMPRTSAIDGAFGMPYVSG